MRIVASRNVGYRFIFPEINAYQAIKLHHVKIRGALRNNDASVATAAINITVDEDYDTYLQLPIDNIIFSGFKTGQVWMLEGIVANTIHNAANIENISEKFDFYERTVGDSVSIYIYTTLTDCTYTGYITVTYEIINTSFDQFGQCEKTLKRAMKKL